MVYNENTKMYTYKYRNKNREYIRQKESIYSALYRLTKPENYHNSQIKYKQTQREFAIFRNILLPDELITPRKPRTKKVVEKDSLRDMYIRYMITNNTKCNYLGIENDTQTYDEWIAPLPISEDEDENDDENYVDFVPLKCDIKVVHMNHQNYN